MIDKTFTRLANKGKSGRGEGRDRKREGSEKGMGQGGRDGEKEEGGDSEERREKK